MGGNANCADYVSLAISVGVLNISSVDFCELIPLFGQMKPPPTEPNIPDANQCVILHLADAYEWRMRGYPSRHPDLPRVETAAMELIQEEYHAALAFMLQAESPSTLREYAPMSAVRDGLRRAMTVVSKTSVGAYLDF